MLSITFQIHNIFCILNFDFITICTRTNAWTINVFFPCRFYPLLTELVTSSGGRVGSGCEFNKKYFRLDLYDAHQPAEHIHIDTWLIEAYWCHLATKIWVDIGSGNGLLPDGTKP